MNKYERLIKGRKMLREKVIILSLKKNAKEIEK